MPVFFKRRGTVSPALRPLPSKRPLNQYNWYDISRISRAGKASEYWSIGDQTSINIGGTIYAVDIIGFDHDTPTDATNYGRSKAGITFQMHDLEGTLYRMNSEMSTEGGWENSEMRTSTLPRLSNLLRDDGLREVIVPVNKITWVGGSPDAVGLVTTSDGLFLLAADECNANSRSTYAHESETAAVTKYAYYTNVNRMLKKRNGAYSTWWTRSPSGSISFCCVMDTGSPNGISANATFGVSFAFCV